MLPVCIYCGGEERAHRATSLHAFKARPLSTPAPTPIETTPPKESTVDNTTDLAWRVSVNGVTVAACSSGENAIRIGRMLSNDLTELSIWFTTEKV